MTARVVSCGLAVFSVILVAWALAAQGSPSLWLPVCFGFAFYGLLGFGQRISRGPTRVGASVCFLAGSCYLWLGSGQFPSHPTMLLVAGVSAFVGVLISTVTSEAKARPSLLPVALLTILGWLISYFSSSHGGANPMIDWVIRNFGWDKETAERVVIALRKTIHISFYAVAALAGYAMARTNFSSGNVSLTSGLVTALAYASFDELRQSAMPDRVGSTWDVLLDMAGAASAMLVLHLIDRRKSHKDRKLA